MSPVLFAAGAYHAQELLAADVPRLQALFDANPDYFLAINGRRPHADEAQIEFDELPPPHLGCSRRWPLGLFDGEGQLVGVAIVVADLGVAGVWHLALFLVATRLHGQGVAHTLYGALEAWVAASGASWLRLGVVQGNGRAEGFWRRQGYRQVRVRERIDTGGRVNDVRVLVKPLGAQGLDLYLARVPRDQPGSTLP